MIIVRCGAENGGLFVMGLRSGAEQERTILHCWVEEERELFAVGLKRRDNCSQWGWRKSGNCYYIGLR